MTRHHTVFDLNQGNQADIPFTRPEEIARDKEEARQVGLSVANSNLVNTAVFGRDPTWGRLLCAVVHSGVAIESERVWVALCGMAIYRG